MSSAKRRKTITCWFKSIDNQIKNLTPLAYYAPVKDVEEKIIWYSQYIPSLGGFLTQDGGVAKRESCILLRKLTLGGEIRKAENALKEIKLELL